MKDFQHFFIDNFSKEEHEKYMKKWLGGIKSEIEFWDMYFSTKGLEWKKGYNDMISYEREFNMMKYIEGDKNSKVKFLDVGSGPLSSCGSKTSVIDLEFQAVDPLANAYKWVKKKNGIFTKIQPEFAMVENLSLTFEENSFDYVHMRNSLDHSFNPILGIAQLLYVCKIGGKVILIHRDNEAEFENYVGLHQWNLQVINDQFLIWRGNRQFNVQEIFGDIIDIEVVPSESREGLHEVILSKKKRIEEIKDPLLEQSYVLLFNEFLKLTARNYFNSIENKNDNNIMLNLPLNHTIRKYIKIVKDIVGKYR